MFAAVGSAAAEPWKFHAHPEVWLLIAGIIALGVTVTKFYHASRVVHPLIRSQIHRAGIRLLPMVSFLAFALGFVIVGQTVSLLQRVGFEKYAGLVMVSVVVRELGPLITALLVLARVGFASMLCVALSGWIQAPKTDQLPAPTHRTFIDLKLLQPAAPTIKAHAVVAPDYLKGENS